MSETAGVLRKFRHPVFMMVIIWFGFIICKTVLFCFNYMFVVFYCFVWIICLRYFVFGFDLLFVIFYFFNINGIKPETIEYV